MAFDEYKFTTISSLCFFVCLHSMSLRSLTYLDRVTITFKMLLTLMLPLTTDLLYFMLSGLHSCSASAVFYFLAPLGPLFHGLCLNRETHSMLHLHYFFPPTKGAAYKIILPLDAVGVHCTYAKTNCGKGLHSLLWML